MERRINPFVSIIIPVHNASNYLKQCLETLIHQTLKEIEIICIVDAPTDGSDLVVKEFSERDNRVKVIYNEKNLNISESRNRGLKVATGKYIGFSDHDDWRELNMYEKLYEKAKQENADIVTSNSYLVRNDIREIHKYNNSSCEGIISSIILPIWSQMNPNTLSKSVWASIYRKSFLSSYNIYFPDKRIYHEEDTLFNLMAFIHASKICHLDEVFYNWIIHETSASNQQISNPIISEFNLFRSIEDILRKNNLLKKYQKELGILISTNIFANIYQYRNLTNPEFKCTSRFLFYLKMKFVDRTLIINISKKKLFWFYILKIKLIIYNIRSYIPQRK
jgi:glycosyltransferase involved in cell wall biosynthesis